MLKKVTKKEQKLSKTLSEEHFDIAQRHLRRYANSANYAGVPFGEIKDRMQELVEKILENL